jgi:hypothetical protein
LGPLILGAHPLRQIEQRAEASFQRRIAINLAADVADDPTESRPQELELAPGALELMSVGIGADHDGGALRQAQIALAQRHTVALGESDELSDGPMHQPRVGRMRNGLNDHVDGAGGRLFHRLRYQGDGIQKMADAS